jgi:hypothetical protein
MNESLRFRPTIAEPSYDHLLKAKEAQKRNCRQWDSNLERLETIKVMRRKNVLPHAGKPYENAPRKRKARP